MSTTFTVQVPATSANLGPGYDSFGIALDISDTVVLHIEDAPVASAECVSITGEGESTLPRDRSHLIMKIIAEVVESEYDRELTEILDRVRLECTNRIPHSRGLGSSAAAVVAGIALAGCLGEWAGQPGLSRQQVLEYATEYEGHPDNAAPAVFGGLTVSVVDPVRSWQIPVSTMSTLTVIVPDHRLDTEIARSVIPDSIAHSIAAANSARTGLLVHGFSTDASALMDATEDRLHQEFRRPAFPESMALVDELRAAGLPAVISGAGPTVLVLAPTLDRDYSSESIRVVHTAIDLNGYTIARHDETQISANAQDQVN